MTALGNRAYILEQLGRYDEAIKDLSDILAQEPNNIMAMKHMGFIYRQKREPAQALKWYRMALKIEEDESNKNSLNAEIKDLERIAKQGR